MTTLQEYEPRRRRRAKRPPAKPTETKQQREKRLKKGRAEKVKLRERLVEDDDAVLTFREWCTLNGLSERLGRRILTGGNGPTVTDLSDRRSGVTRSNNRIWQAARARLSDHKI